MSKNRGRQRAQKVCSIDQNALLPFKKKKFSTERRPQPIVAKNHRQARYIDCLQNYPQVLVLGPAGTGKTWIASTYAADLYRQGLIEKIILTRPNVPCGPSLGFFPGSMEDKFSPWAVPITDAIRERLGNVVFDIAVKNGGIEMVPFETMRGRSWRNAFILLDEAQNTTEAEIKMFLTRIGEDCLTVINGDIEQCDLPHQSGMRKVLEIINAKSLPVPVVEFTVADIVRSDLCAMWVRAFHEVSCES